MASTLDNINQLPFNFCEILTCTTGAILGDPEICFVPPKSAATKGLLVVPRTSHEQPA